MARRLLAVPVCTLLFACGGEEVPDTRNDVVSGLGTTTAGDRLEAVEVRLRREDGERTFAVAELLNVEVTDFRSSGLPFNRALATGPVAPAPDARAALLEDAAINTGLHNPGRAVGLSFRFVTPEGIPSSISNREGPDLFIFELGQEGGVRGDDGLAALPGDPFTLRGLGFQAADRTADFGTGGYVRLGDGRVPNVERFSNVGPDDPASPVLSLEELEQASLQSLGPITLELFAVAVDLDDLGYKEGESVQGLELARVDEEESPDPCLILGIPDTVSR